LSRRNYHGTVLHHIILCLYALIVVCNSTAIPKYMLCWLLTQVRMPEALMLQISEVCSLLDVDGIRGDMTINKAATALTALEARDEVTAADVQRVIAMCLNHRYVRLDGCILLTGSDPNRPATETWRPRLQRVMALCLTHWCV